MMRRILCALTLGAVALTGCATKDPLATEQAAVGANAELVVGSQQYYSNEIIAELYAQVLEKAGRKVKRQYQIGQREVYIPELKAGKIDVFPEYAGNLLQYLNKETKAATQSEITAELATSLPQGLRLLKAATATDQDSYVVTKENAAKGVASIADLPKLGKVSIAGNSELAERPYGPKGLKSVYGVDATVVPVEDSGGPLTVKALQDGTVNVADIYTSDPAIAMLGLVVLSDPKTLILPQNVTPIVSTKVNDDAAAAIAKVNAALTTEELQKLNAESVAEKKKTADIAKEWLTSKGLL